MGSLYNGKISGGMVGLGLPLGRDGMNRGFSQDFGSPAFPAPEPHLSPSQPIGAGGEPVPIKARVGTGWELGLREQQ